MCLATTGNLNVPRLHGAISIGSSFIVTSLGSCRSWYGCPCPWRNQFPGPDDRPLILHTQSRFHQAIVDAPVIGRVVTLDCRFSALVWTAPALTASPSGSDVAEGAMARWLGGLKTPHLSEPTDISFSSIVSILPPNSPAPSSISQLRTQHGTMNPEGSRKPLAMAMSDQGNYSKECNRVVAALPCPRPLSAPRDSQISGPPREATRGGRTDLRNTGELDLDNTSERIASLTSLFPFAQARPRPTDATQSLL